MLRKIATVGILLSSLLLLSSTPSWSAFYVGVDVGPQWADFNQKARITRPFAFNVEDETDLSGLGVFGTLFGGYSWNYERFYLDGEVNGDISSVQFQTSNKELLHETFSHTRFKITHSYGVSLLPGFLITDSTLLYARVGYINGNFKVRTTDISLANINRDLNGVRYGVGVNQAVSQHFSFRVEYSHVNYESAHINTFDPIGNTTKRTRISPETGQVEFGLVYHFV